MNIDVHQAILLNCTLDVRGAQGSPRTRYERIWPADGLEGTPPERPAKKRTASHSGLVPTGATTGETSGLHPWSVARFVVQHRRLIGRYGVETIPLSGQSDAVAIHEHTLFPAPGLGVELELAGFLQQLHHLLTQLATVLLGRTTVERRITRMVETRHEHPGCTGFVLKPPAAVNEVEKLGVNRTRSFQARSVRYSDYGHPPTRRYPAT